MFLEVLVRLDFSADKVLFDIRMNDTGSLGSLCSLPDGPGSDFIRTTGEESNQVERSVTSRGDLAQCTGSSDLLFLLQSFFLTHVSETLLKLDREGNQEITRVVLVNPSLDLWKVLVLLADVISLRQVDKVNDGLGGEELQCVDDFNL